jgi:hypothetical protein
LTIDLIGCRSSYVEYMSTDFEPLGATQDERQAYLDARMITTHEVQGGEGFLIFGGEEVMLLWESLTASFGGGNWIAVILAAQGMCERGLADMYEMQDLPGVQDLGRRNSESAALGTLLRWAREDGILKPEVAAKIQVVCDRRKVLTHRRPPLEPGTIMHRAVEKVTQDGVDDFYRVRDELLAGDAMVAIDAVFEFCFGNQADMLKYRPS